MARLSFRCDAELVVRVDAERGLIPREAWLRRAVERALDGEPAPISVESPPPTPAEQPERPPAEVEALGQLSRVEAFRRATQKQ